MTTPQSEEVTKPERILAPIPFSQTLLSTNYESVGLTSDFVRQRIANVHARGYSVEVPRDMRIVGDPYECIHGDVLYLNSSDSFRCLSAASNIANGRVLSVAGSGDFPLAFIEKGVKELDVIDVSMPACFYSELKIVAAHALDFHSFRKLFTSFAASEQIALLKDDQPANLPIFDLEIYRQVRQCLSEPAQTYFDTITSENISPLFSVQVRKRDDQVIYKQLSKNQVGVPSDNGLIRLRGSLTENFTQGAGALSPYVMNPERFLRLKENLPASTIRINLQSFAKLDYGISHYDFIYVSNAGFKQLPTLLAYLFGQGAERIGFTLDNVKNQGMNAFELKERISQRLIPELGENLQVRSVKIDRQSRYGIYVEIMRRKNG